MRHLAFLLGRLSYQTNSTRRRQRKSNAQLRCGSRRDESAGNLVGLYSLFFAKKRVARVSATMRGGHANMEFPDIATLIRAALACNSEIERARFRVRALRAPE